MSTAEQSGQQGEMGENPYANLGDEKPASSGDALNHRVKRPTVVHGAQAPVEPQARPAAAEAHVINGIKIDRDPATGAIIDHSAEAMSTLDHQEASTAKEFTFGQDVWIPRSSGAIEQAQVLSEGDTSVRVAWVDKDNVTWDKTIKKDQLAALQASMQEHAFRTDVKKAVPNSEILKNNEAKPVPSFEVGQSVDIIRSFGARQAAEVSAISPDGSSVTTSWTENGQVFDKKVGADELQLWQADKVQAEAPVIKALRVEPRQLVAEKKEVQYLGFKVGDVVRYDDGSIGQRQYEIEAIERSDARLMEMSDNRENAIRTPTVDIVELRAMQDPAYVSRGQREQDAKAAAEPKPSLRNRLANRIAGNK